MIVVTGATGKLGRHVVEGLLKKVPASEIAVAVRNVEKAADIAKLGVAVRRADYTDAASLAEALRGAEKVLLISSSELGQRAVQHAAVIAAAKSAGVSLLVYTSILRADRSTLGLAAEHKATEDAIRASGIPYVFLRNGWYIENYTENLAGALAHGALSGSAGSGKIAAATRRDFADAAVEALTGPDHRNKIYELAGTAFTMSELAAAVAQGSGKAVAYRDLPPEEYRALLLGFGIPAPYADLLVDSDLGIARGELDDSTGDLERLIGRKLTPLSSAITAAL